MSLILDALNRSRDAVDAVPNLATHHPVEPVSSGSRQYWLWVALIVALGLVAWLAMERFAVPPAPMEDIGAPVAELSQNIGSAATSVTAELKARAAAQQEKALQPGVAQPAPVATIASPVVVTEVSEEAEVVEAQVLPENQSAGKPAAVVKARTPRPARENAAVEKLYQSRGVEEEPEMQEPTSAAGSDSGTAANENVIDIEDVLQRAQQEVENARLDDHPVPFLSSLSQQTKDEIPTLYYQRHDYSSDGSVSTVVLNGKAVKVGASPLPGMKVEEILPDSVVLSYQGTQFRLRALSSWINL